MVKPLALVDAPRGRRVERDKGRSAYTASVPERLLYFAILPVEMLDIVFKFLSGLPGAVNWGKYIYAGDVLALMRVDIRWRAFLSTQFNTLCVSKTIDCSYERQAYKWKKRYAPMLWTDNINEAHDFVMMAGGELLHTIIVGADIYDKDLSGTDMVDDFLKACPNLRSLSVVDISDVWVTRFASQLEVLEVASGSPFHAFPKCCPLLRELNLSYAYRREENEDYFLYDMDDISWNNVGTQLESLTLSHFIPFMRGYKDIRKYCRNLKRIILDEPQYANKNMANFIASYASQVDYAYIYRMEDSESNELVHSCRKARFHAGFLLSRLSIRTLRTLGPQLVKADVVFSGGEVNQAEWTNAWNSCVNLRSVSVQGFNRDRIAEIFTTPKHNLKEINILGAAESNDMKTVLETIARGTRCVEIMFYEGFTASADYFDKFVNKNKSTLRSITVLNYEDPMTLSSITEMTEKFLECPVLEELSFLQEPERRLVNTLQRRGIHLRVPNENCRKLVKAKIGEDFLHVV